LNRIFLTSITFIVSIFLSGCAGQCDGVEVEDVVPKLDLRKTFNEMSAELCCGVDVCVMPTRTVLVTDFVEIDSFESDSSGMFMSELLKSSLNQKCNYTIQQAEFSKYFKLDKGGFVALTRNANEIKLAEAPLGVSAIVGTFKYSADRLYIFVREINIHTGKISKFITREIPFTCVGDNVIRTDFKIMPKN